jgi:hypothetical protein
MSFIKERSLMILLIHRFNAHSTLNVFTVNACGQLRYARSSQATLLLRKRMGTISEALDLTMLFRTVYADKKYVNL